MTTWPPWPRRPRQPRRSAAEGIRWFRQPGPRAPRQTRVLERRLSTACADDFCGNARVTTSPGRRHESTPQGDYSCNPSARNSRSDPARSGSLTPAILNYPAARHNSSRCRLQPARIIGIGATKPTPAHPCYQLVIAEPQACSDVDHAETPSERDALARIRLDYPDG